MTRELHIVGFEVGRETYGLPITSLHEIVRVPAITAVPDTPAYVEGVINLRGKIVSIIDLRKRFGVNTTKAHRANRILVVEHKGRLCGLIVDSASEVLKLPEDSIEPPPDVFEQGSLNCVTGLAKLRGRLIVLIDVNRLLEVRAESASGNDGEPANRNAEAATAGRSR